MKRFNRMIITWYLLFSGMVILPRVVAAQDYDYRKEEGPVVTWNTARLYDARLMGTGGVSFMASPAFAAVLNPALAVGPDRDIALAVTYDYLSYQAFQYWGINTGVMVEPQVQVDGLNGFSGVGLRLPLAGVSIAAGWYRSGSFSFPGFDYDYRYWGYKGQFSGAVDTFFAALAGKLSPKFTVGLKLAYDTGTRRVFIEELYKYYQNDGYPVDSSLSIVRREEHRLSMAVVDLGAVLNLSPHWDLAAVVSYPFKGRAERTLENTFDNHFTPAIADVYKSRDPLYRPALVRLGTAYRRQSGGPGEGRRFVAALELEYARWSRYRFVYFSEEMPRDFRDCLVMALGVESVRLGEKVDSFLRAGYRFDPQPLKSPRQIVHTFSLGMGIGFRLFSLDLGVAYHRAHSRWINQNHWVINGTLWIKL